MCGKTLPVLNFQLMLKQKSELSLCEQGAKCLPTGTTTKITLT